jgi:hypothetical protein
MYHCFHPTMSTAYQAGYQLWEKEHEKDDYSSTPEQGDAQRANLIRAGLRGNVDLPPL